MGRQMNFVVDDMAPFASPKALIAEAREDIEALSGLIEKCINDTKGKIVREKVGQAGQIVVKAVYSKPIDPKIRVKASRVFEDLRHSLDQSVNDGALELGAPKGGEKYFPFCKDPADLQNQINRKCKAVHPDLVKLIVGFQPYMGGNSELWAMSSVAGKTKHNRLLLAARYGTKINFDQGDFFATGPMVMHMKWNEKRNELELARMGAQATMTGDFSIPVEIVLGDAPVFGGQPIVEVLLRLADDVERIVLAIEAETARIRALVP